MTAPEHPPELDARRDQTNESLEAERHKTDELVKAGAELRSAQEAVEARLEEVRRETDGQLEKQKQALPQVSETLEAVAETLTAAATNLSGVAEAIEQSAVETMNAAMAAERLNETVGTLGHALGADQKGSSAEQPPVGEVLGQLAAVANGMADVTAALLEEREEADQHLERERALTDRILEQHSQDAQAAIAEQLPVEPEAIAEARETTDTHLAAERETTDQAVDQVLGLLSGERAAHAAAIRKSATRNEFIGIVSHDLRTPLGAIGIVARLIGQAAPDDENGRRIRNWVRLLGRSVSTMERLIGDLLDFASLEDGRLQVVATAHDVRGVVSRSVEAFQPVASTKSIALTADLPSPIEAVFDEHRIEQVVANLLHNAVKFTPAGGEIRVRADAADTEAIVTVTDSGIGVPEREAAAVFERFRRLNEGDAPEAGLGLGLYISKWIVEAHQGRIWCESRPGAGSTFRFTLPRA